jgi:phospholipid transport system substrate-binding protein
MNRLLHNTYLRILLAVLTIAVAPSPVRATDVTPDQGPEQIIQNFQDTLIAVMKQGKQLGYAGRYRMLEPVVEKTHDLGAIARVAVGQYWMQLDTTQRNELVDTFSKLSIATYASRFDSYAGERFSKPEAAKTANERAIVNSDLIESDGNKVSFAYQLHFAEGKWRIVNIIANGVSDLAMKRAEYTGIIKDNGFATLIDKLKQKISQYQKEGSG